MQKVLFELELAIIIIMFQLLSYNNVRTLHLPSKLNFIAALSVAPYHRYDFEIYNTHPLHQYF